MAAYAADSLLSEDIQHANMPKPNHNGLDSNPEFKILTRFRVGIMYYLHRRCPSQRTGISSEQT